MFVEELLPSCLLICINTLIVRYSVTWCVETLSLMLISTMKIICWYKMKNCFLSICWHSVESARTRNMKWLRMVKNKEFSLHGVVNSVYQFQAPIIIECAKFQEHAFYFVIQTNVDVWVTWIFNLNALCQLCDKVHASCCIFLRRCLISTLFL